LQEHAQAQEIQFGSPDHYLKSSDSWLCEATAYWDDGGHKYGGGLCQRRNQLMVIFVSFHPPLWGRMHQTNFNSVVTVDMHYRGRVNVETWHHNPYWHHTMFRRES